MYNKKFLLTSSISVVRRQEGTSMASACSDNYKIPFLLWFTLNLM